MKKSPFFWWKRLGLGPRLGNPPPPGPQLRQNPNKITVLYGCGFKKLGFGQTPSTPLVGTKSQLWPKICFAGSPHHIISIWWSIPPSNGRHFWLCSISLFLNLSTGDLGNVESWPGRHLSAKTQFQIPMLDTSHRLCCVQIFYVGVLHIFKICSWSVINHVMFDI